MSRRRRSRRYPRGGGWITIRAMPCDSGGRPRLPSVANLDGTAGGTHGRAQDFDVRAASAKIMPQRFQHVRFGRLRFTNEQRLGAHDHAVETVAALRGLFRDERLLHRIGMVAGAKTFERHHLASDAAFDRNDAGACRDAADQYGAGAALAEAATIFRSVQFEIVAQHVKQGSIGSRFDVAAVAVDGQADRGLRHMAQAPAVVLQRQTKFSAERYCLYTNVQAAHTALQPSACFLNSDVGKFKFFSATLF